MEFLIPLILVMVIGFTALIIFAASKASNRNKSSSDRSRTATDGGMHATSPISDRNYDKDGRSRSDDSYDGGTPKSSVGNGSDSGGHDSGFSGGGDGGGGGGD